MIIRPERRAGHCLAKIQLTSENYVLLDNMPGYKKWDGRELCFRPTAVCIAYVLAHWPGADWTDGTDEYVHEYNENIEQHTANLMAKKKVLDDDGLYEYKRAPMAHQRQGFLLGRDQAYYAYLMGQGTGKTKVALDDACYNYLADKIDMLIVIAWPNGVHRNWNENELPEDVSVPYLDAYWSSPLTKTKGKQLQKIIDADRSKHLKIITFNVECFISDKAKNWILNCLDNNRCMVVIDQSASIKTPTAKRTKFLIKHVARHPNCILRRILDGDPATEGPEELYSQFYFLDPMIIGHDTFTGFKAEFCRTVPAGRGSRIVGYKNMDELHRRIEGYCYRVLEQDCLDLPKRIYKRWHFDLNLDERRLWDDIQSKGVAEFEGSILEVKMPLVKNLRLQQIASGWMPTDKKPTRISIESTRMKATLAIMDEIGDSSVIIFSRFRADLTALEHEFGKRAVSYHGGVSEDNRSLAKKLFQAGEKQIFLGQQRNAGIGHTLTAAKHIIFYNNDPSLRFRAESEKRAHRKGQEFRLTIWDLVASKTTDKKTINMLRHKRDVATEILKDPESFFLIEE